MTPITENPKISILKRALADPVVENILVVSKKRPEDLERLLEVMGKDGVVSEWRYGGVIRYEYHLHSRELGDQLGALLNEGFVGGNPPLTDVYFRVDIERVLESARSPQGHVASSSCNPRADY